MEDSNKNLKKINIKEKEININKSYNLLNNLTSETSLSFLENPFNNEIYNEINNTELKLKEFENIEKIFFPKLLYETFKYNNIEKIAGEYLIHKTLIKETKYFVTNYPISITNNSKLIIVLGRKKWEDSIKKKEISLYLKSIKNNEFYSKPNSIEFERKRLLNKQIIENINFFYLETLNDLNIFIESLKYENKIKKPFKKFTKSKSKELFNYLIGSVLGVNKLAAKSICNKFIDLNTFMQEAEETDFTKIEYLVNGIKKNITKSIEKNIKKFFFFKLKNDFIYK